MIKKIIYMSFMLLSIISVIEANTFPNGPTVNTDKNHYTSNESIVVSFSDMEAQNKDWIGIYPVGTTNDWANKVQWNWTEDEEAGTMTFESLPVGTYDVRVFYNNSFTTEVSKQIVIDANAIATSVKTSKNTYLEEEGIIAIFDNMSGGDDDWIGIYPVGSTNAWANMLQWEWIEDGLKSGTQTFEALPVGNYEVRVFFNNEYDDEATYAFSVEAPVNKATVETTKNTYLVGKNIVATFDNMSGNEGDWIGIYPAASTNAWANMLQWEWIDDDLISGTQSFDALPVGNYEVRVFFNDSFDDEAVYAFSVKDVPAEGVSLALNKKVYAQNELIDINYRNMKGNNHDWIGIYLAGASNALANVIDYKETFANINGEISLGGVDAFPDVENNPGGLAPGNYEVRAFNRLVLKTVKSFTVRAQAVSSTVYESANGSISPNWIHISGPTAPYYNQGRVNLKPNWINAFVNTSEFRLVFPQVNTTQKVLELDAGGVRWLQHFFIGVVLETTDGPRKMIWDPFFSHGDVPAFKSGQYLSYPLYVDIQVRSEEKIHVRVDVEKYLRILEPNNKVLSISAFMASGGDLDEIKLSSH